MEAYNAFNPDQEPVTWGNIWRGMATRWYETNALRAEMKERKGWLGYFGASYMDEEGKQQLMAANGITENDLYSQMTPQQAALVKHKETPQSVRKMEALTETIQNATGEEATQTQPVIRMLLRGNLSQDVIAQFAEAGFNAGYSMPEYGSVFSGMAEQKGLAIGSAGWNELAETFAGGLSPEQVEKMRLDAEQNARYGGMFSPYYSDPLAGNQLAERYQVRTQPQAQAIQGFLASAALFGQDPNEVMSYRMQARGRGYEAVPVTFGDLVAQLTQTMTPYQAQLGANLTTRLGSFDVEMPTAIRAVQDYGITNDAQMGAATSYLSFGQQYGVNTPGFATSALGLSQLQNPYQTSAGLQIAERLVNMGNMDPESALRWVSGQNLTNRQMTLASRAMGGDLSAWSAIGRDTGNAALQFTNSIGEPIISSNGLAYVDMTYGQADLGNPFAVQGACLCRCSSRRPDEVPDGCHPSLVWRRHRRLRFGVCHRRHLRDANPAHEEPGRFPGRFRWRGFPRHRAAGKLPVGGGKWRHLGQPGSRIVLVPTKTGSRLCRTSQPWLTSLRTASEWKCKTSSRSSKKGSAWPA